MTPAAALERATALPAQETFGIDPLQAVLFRTLNENFGPTGWTVNDDHRFCSEIECHPIDIIAPAKKHGALLEKVVNLQAELSRKHDIHVYFVLTEPD